VKQTRHFTVTKTKASTDGLGFKITVTYLLVLSLFLWHHHSLALWRAIKKFLGL